MSSGALPHSTASMMKDRLSLTMPPRVLLCVCVCCLGWCSAVPFSSHHRGRAGQLGVSFTAFEGWWMDRVGIRENRKKSAAAASFSREILRFYTRDKQPRLALGTNRAVSELSFRFVLFFCVACGGVAHGRDVGRQVSVICPSCLSTSSTRHRTRFVTCRSRRRTSRACLYGISSSMHGSPSSRSCSSSCGCRCSGAASGTSTRYLLHIELPPGNEPVRHRPKSIDPKRGTWEGLDGSCHSCIHFCCPEQVRNESVYQQEEEATAYIR